MARRTVANNGDHRYHSTAEGDGMALAEQFLMPEPLGQTVLGYHATTMQDAQIILGTRTFKASTATGEWLGHGVYFWNTESMARWWAKRRSFPTPAVIVATLLLGYCLDLMDMEVFAPVLQMAHRELRRATAANGKQLPQNHGDERQLDCAVINTASALTCPPFDSVRALFEEGNPAYDGAALRARAHVQICMRNLDGILYPRLLPRS
jgi:hypothetical protein